MERYILTNTRNIGKKAQVWSLDVIVAIIIFTSGIILLFIFAINYTNQAENKLDDLLSQGRTAAELILSNEDSGILSGNIINQTKLESLYNSDYEILRSKFGVKNNFYFTFDGLEINGSFKEYGGKVNSTSIKSLIKIERLSIYKNKPIKFDLYIWE